MQTKKIASALFALTLVLGVASAFAAISATSGADPKSDTVKCDCCPNGKAAGPEAKCELKDKTTGANCCADKSAKKESSAACDDCSCCTDCDPSACSHRKTGEATAAKPKG